jgi:putative hemolysin
MNKLNFSYASKLEHNFAQRLIIKTIENVTGKRKLEKLYRDYSENAGDPVYFWRDILKLMDIKINNKSSYPLKVPSTGPLMVIANHPFGIIDGLILCSLISDYRTDFKIMTHETLQFLPQLSNYILPVDFSNNKNKTIKNNIEIAKQAKKHLYNDKGVLIVFPSGSVSTAKNILSEAQDDDWKLFPAKLIHQTKSDILPIYFEGKNGLLFHLFASKINNQTLKYSTYIHETKKKLGKKINIYSGRIINYENIKSIKNRSELMNYLKNITYKLKDKN